VSIVLLTLAGGCSRDGHSVPAPLGDAARPSTAPARSTLVGPEMVPLEELRAWDGRLLRRAGSEPLLGSTLVGAGAFAETAWPDGVGPAREWRLGWTEDAVVVAPDVGALVEWTTCGRVEGGLVAAAPFSDHEVVAMTRAGDVFLVSLCGRRPMLAPPARHDIEIETHARDLAERTPHPGGAHCLLEAKEATVDIRHAVRGCFFGGTGEIHLTWRRERGTIAFGKAPPTVVDRERPRAIVAAVVRELEATVPAPAISTNHFTVEIHYRCDRGAMESTSVSDNQSDRQERVLGPAQSTREALMIAIARDAKAAGSP